MHMYRKNRDWNPSKIVVHYFIHKLGITFHFVQVRYKLQFLYEWEQNLIAWIGFRYINNTHPEIMTFRLLQVYFCCLLCLTTQFHTITCISVVLIYLAIHSLEVQRIMRNFTQITFIRNLNTISTHLIRFIVCWLQFCTLRWLVTQLNATKLHCALCNISQLMFFIVFN